MPLILYQQVYYTLNNSDRVRGNISCMCCSNQSALDLAYRHKSRGKHFMYVSVLLNGNFFKGNLKYIPTVYSLRMTILIFQVCCSVENQW